MNRRIVTKKISKIGCGNAGQHSFEEPSLQWLVEKFTPLRLGSLKASELEVYLAYMLMYHRNQLNADSFLLAEEYGMTEQKIRRLQVEFAKRFSVNEEGVEIIAEGIFGNVDDRIVLDLSNDQKSVSFSVKNAAWMHALKVLLAKEGLTWREERNPRAITLEMHVFAYVFRSRLMGPLDEVLGMNKGVSKIACRYKTVGEMPQRNFLDWAKINFGEIASVIASVASIASDVVPLLK